MANVFVDENALQDIADAIRSKNGTQTTYKPREMAEAIEAISGGGIIPTGTISITSNNTYDVTNYASAEVNVPTGGVTPTGTKQISISQNGTVTEDVTNYANAEITVSVSGSDLIDTLVDGSIVSYSSQTVTKIKSNCFLDVTTLTSVSAPFVTSIYSSAFSGCVNLETCNLPLLSSIASSGQYAFRNCSKLKVASFPSLATIESNTFNNCSSLETADILGNIIRASAFSGCSSLSTIIIRKNGVSELNNVNAFNNTKYASGGEGGTIYVPSAQIDSYKTATNWKTLYDAGTITFSAIEGSYYETHYADGSAISA